MSFSLEAISPLIYQPPPEVKPFSRPVDPSIAAALENCLPNNPNICLNLTFIGQDDRNAATFGYEGLQHPHEDPRYQALLVLEQVEQYLDTVLGTQPGANLRRHSAGITEIDDQNQVYILDITHKELNALSQLGIFQNPLDRPIRLPGSDTEIIAINQLQGQVTATATIPPDSSCADISDQITPSLEEFDQAQPSPLVTDTDLLSPENGQSPVCIIKLTPEQAQSILSIPKRQADQRGYYIILFSTIGAGTLLVGLFISRRLPRKQAKPK